ncbi:uncharacterized protein LOC128238040 [Mya arenaria]|uniref:uncharacterized protein LOC128238040 n=1 Tax=Mya arenaria TaxID=6604 RepID=UPI0022E572AE|nr:uncharacterized protein LOC128238040 [Mya arenaria]
MNFWKKKNKDKKKVVYDNFEETYDERYCQPSNAYYEPTPFGGGRRHNSEVEVPEYQKLVDIYRNDIRLRLIPKQILHLLFLMDDTDKDAIKRLGESGPAPATDLLLDCIRSSPDQGKWREFINALEKTKYICLVKKIRRQKVKDDTDEREYIRIMMPQLRNLINPREIMAHLLYHDIIISDDKEEIECVMSNSGSIEASELLLERVSGKHPNWYPILTRELIQHGHQSAGNILLEGICRENTLKENPSMMTPGTRSKSDSQLMQPKYQSVAAATGIETQYPAYSGRNYAFNKLPIHFDEDEDEVYMDIDEAELDRLEANRHSPKRERKVRTVDFSYLTPKHSRKTYNEVKAVHFTGPEEDDKSSIYTIPPPDYDDEEPVQPPSPPSRLPIRTRPDLA